MRRLCVSLRLIPHPLDPQFADGESCNPQLINPTVSQRGPAKGKLRNSHLPDRQCAHPSAREQSA